MRTNCHQVVTEYIRLASENDLPGKVELWIGEVLQVYQFFSIVLVEHAMEVQSVGMCVWSYISVILIKHDTVAEN